ncbi:DUF881 domain-containing protein [Nocardioides sp. KR10-350]|uniref:DUF881 domain-containing protein n=1 Tax=Nocardioides cheoyonin TaxID=3156615 RepID=UPI0032B5AD28
MGVTRGSHAGAHERPDAHRLRSRLTAWRVGTPVVVLVCGGLLAVSAANSHGTDLRPGRYTDLASLVQSEADRYHALEDRVTRLNSEVESLSDAVSDREVARYHRRVEQLEDPAGLTPRSGPGVSITLSDAPTELIDSTDLDPNLLVVHQQDIQAVVNALWQGGATAVTIAGKRIITTTGIKCSGSTVQLQGVPYPEPFVIKAVGDPDSLETALDNDSYVSLYKSQSEDPRIDIGWDFSREDHVTAPAYDGLLSLHYAQPLDGG